MLAFQSVGVPELLIILLIAGMLALPIYVTHVVLRSRGRSDPWKLVVVFFTGWLGALVFIAFDR